MRRTWKPISWTSWSYQVGSLQSAAGPQDIYSEGGWFASAARHPDLRRQIGTEGDRHGAGSCVRAGLPSLLIRVPAWPIGASGITDFAHCLHEPKIALGARYRHRKILRFDSALPPSRLS